MNSVNANMKNERARLQAELKVKQESFVKKERVYKAKIEVSSVLGRYPEFSLVVLVRTPNFG